MSESNLCLTLCARLLRQERVSGIHATAAWRLRQRRFTGFDTNNRTMITYARVRYSSMDVDMSVLGAGLVWYAKALLSSIHTSLMLILPRGLPVRPDLLAEGLKAFERAEKKLHALRLCHRYGHGPKAFVTKLSNELEHMIEECVLEDERNVARRAGEFRDAFKHFEGRCEPPDHVSDPEVFEIYENYATDRDLHCETCLTSDGEPGEKCENDCEVRIREHQNEFLAERGDYGDWCQEHQEACQTWSGMIDQTSIGRFPKYDKVCVSEASLVSSDQSRSYAVISAWKCTLQRRERAPERQRPGQISRYVDGATTMSCRPPYASWHSLRASLPCSSTA